MMKRMVLLTMWVVTWCAFADDYGFDAWKILARTDRTNRLEKSESGFALTGMASTEKIKTPPNVAFTLSLRAHGKGHLRAYFFEYSYADAPLVTKTAWLFDQRLTDSWQTFKTTVTIRPEAHFSELVLDAPEGAEIGDVKVLASQTVERKESPRMVLTIPRLDAVPPWDGVFRENFWIEHGVTLKNAFRDVSSGTVFPRQSDVYLMADAKNLYAAVVHLIPSGGLVCNQTAHDAPVWLDDAVELHVNPMADDAKPTYAYQIISNAKGVTYDKKSHLAIGQTYEAWTCRGYDVRSGRREKDVGRMEQIWLLRLPFSSVGVDDPSSPFGLTVARAFGNPTEFACLHGAGFTDWMRQTRVRVLKGAPATICTLNDPVGDGRYRLDVELRGGNRSGEVAISCGEAKSERTYPFSGRDGVKAEVNLTRQKLPRATFDVRVTDARGEVLFCDGLAVETANYSPLSVRAAKSTESMRLNVESHPYSKRIVLRWADASEEERAAISDARMAIVAPDGKKTILKGGEKVVYDGIVGFAFPFEPSEAGEYVVGGRVLAGDGKVLAQGRAALPMKKLEWIGNDLGKDDVIVKPYVPLKVGKSGNKRSTVVSCMLRQHVFGANGLLESLTAAGGEVLSEPMSFVVETPAGELKPKDKNFRILKKTDTRIEFSARNSYDGLQILVDGWMEYDGFIWYTLELVPQKSLALTRMKMRIPYRDATLFHYTQKSMRGEDHYHELADLKGEGLIWSREGQRHGRLHSTFMPFFWLGSNRRGLMWFAENDRGWINDEGSSSFDLHRCANGAYAMDVNFVSVPTTIGRPRKIEFGLLANPLKPVKVGAETSFAWQTTFGDPAFNVAATLPDPYITERMVGKSSEDSLLVYLAGQEYIKGDPEVRYIYDELATWPRGYYTLEQPQRKYLCRGQEADAYLSLNYDWTPEAADFFTWRVVEMMRTSRFDGFYLDNTFPTFVYDPFKSWTPGYVRDDGQVQPGCAILPVRDFFKRVAVVAQSLGKTFPRIVVHNTASQFLPRFTFADAAFGGEMNIPKEGEGDHFDVFSSARVETMLGVDWGFHRGMLSMLGYDGNNRQRTRALYACYGIYDFKVWNSGMDEELRKKMRAIQEEFGINASDGTFEMWRDQKFVRLLDPKGDIRVSFYSRSRRKLIMIANHGREARHVEFKLDAEGKLTDAESAGLVSPSADGKYAIDIGGHNFRCLLFEMK